FNCQRSKRLGQVGRAYRPAFMVVSAVELHKSHHRRQGQEEETIRLPTQSLSCDPKNCEPDLDFRSLRSKRWSKPFFHLVLTFASSRSKFRSAALQVPLFYLDSISILNPDCDEQLLDLNMEHPKATGPPNFQVA